MSTTGPEQVLKQLLDAKQLSPSEAERAWMHVPGVYAIFVDTLEALPTIYRDELKLRNTKLIYIGKAEKTLIGRCVEEELRHKRAATFFRSVGAMLGYLPLAGSLAGKRNQNNYRFSAGDTAKIIQWMEDHLKATAVPMQAEEVVAVERAIIPIAKPLLNIAGNPSKFAPLSAARDRCRVIARGDQ